MSHEGVCRMDILSGKMYLFLERVPIKTHYIVRRQLSRGRKVMYISKYSPEMVRSQLQYDERTLNLKWLTSRTDQNCIPPMNLGKLEDEINHFLEANQNGLVVFNGLEVLELWNGLRSIVDMMGRLKGRLKEPDKAILISLEPKNLQAHNISRLTKVTEVIQ